MSGSGLQKMDDRLLRAEDIATFLGVSRVRAYELMANGTLPAIRIRRSVRVSENALKRWIREQEEETQAEARRRKRKTRSVQVLDHDAIRQRLAKTGFIDPITKAITIGAFCPECGSPRAEPIRKELVCGSHRYEVDVWRNDCGHEDLDGDLEREAIFLQRENGVTS